MRMCIKRHVRVALTFLSFSVAIASPALAQKVTTVPDLTGKQVLVQLANPATALSVGDIIATMTAAEIATQPFGTSSGGFVFKLDPSTGLLARTTTSFGPSFTERAITSGEGVISAGATFSSSSYDKLSDFSLSALPMGITSGTSLATAGTTTGNLDLSSQTVAMSGTIGVTADLDVGVIVPLVTVKLAGTSALVNSGGVARLAQTDNVFSGLGDIAATAKYRFVKFKKPDTEVTDPGGIALFVNMRLPTGSRDNLRGLGVTRTLVSGVVSFGRGPIRPHGSVGYEFWSKNVDVLSGNGLNLVKMRNQFTYNGGVEIVAAPKLTLLADFLGQRIMGAGPVDLGPVTPFVGTPGVTATQSLILQDNGITRALFAPGLKLNLKAKLVLSVNALITMTNNGLHSKITPVAGINLTM
jgi:hypothetical protein